MSLILNSIYNFGCFKNKNIKKKIVIVIGKL